MDSVTLLDYPDGRLDESAAEELATHVSRSATSTAAQGLLVFDTTGITGHPDHIHATLAARIAASGLALPVLAWTIDEGVADSLNAEFHVGFAGRRPQDTDLELHVDRSRQREAVTCHPSQAVPGSALWRRLELQGDQERLRWLIESSGPTAAES